jgi:hypothetical protein
MDSSPPSDSARSTNRDSDSLRNDSNFLNDESSNEQPPSLEPVTETSSEPEEFELIASIPLVTEYQAESSLRGLNEHQKRKFSRLRKRVWQAERELELRPTRYYQERLRLHEQCFYFVGVVWCISMCFIGYKLSTISS